MQSEIFTMMFPGMMVMWVFFIGQNTLADIHHEISRKTILRMMAAPVTVTHIVLSKYVHCFLLCLLVELCLIIFTSLVFSIDWGNPILLPVMMLFINFVMTGILALFYGIAKTPNAANGIIVLFILSTTMISGSMFPFEEMPPFMQSIGEWTINRWAILGLQAIMQDQPWNQLWSPVWKMLLVGSLSSFIGIGLLKRRFESGETP